MAEVRLLRPDDDHSRFRSGHPDLDRFFVRYAGQNQFRHYVGATYVAVREGSIVGFATVSAGQVEIADLPEASRPRLPHYPLPVLRLARLAVDASAQGKGIGSLLFVTVCSLALEMARTVGCVGIVVDAKPDAAPFYGKLGFRAMDVRAGALGDRPEPSPMFLPVSAIPPVSDRPA